MPALTATDLRRRFTTRSGTAVGVDGVSLSLEPGQICAVLGPNGSGKSTLMGMLATIDPPDAGSITFGGGVQPAVSITRNSDHRARRAARARLGVVFQTHILDPLLTVRENLRIAAALFNLRGPDARIDECLAMLRVADRAHDRVGTLSGGLARRADLARALLHRPGVLLLDEPATGLDPEARDDLMTALAALRTEPDAPAVLLTTHLTEEAEHADSVIIMEEGRIVTRGAPDELRADLGKRLVIIEHRPDQRRLVADLLEPLGGERFSESDRQTLVTLEAEGPEALFGALLDADLRFRVGPPSLGDVYTARVGKPGPGIDQGPGTGSASGGVS